MIPNQPKPKITIELIRWRWIVARRLHKSWELHEDGEDGSGLLGINKCFPLSCSCHRFLFLWVYERRVPFFELAHLVNCTNTALFIKFRYKYDMLLNLVNLLSEKSGGAYANRFWRGPVFIQGGVRTIDEEQVAVCLRLVEAQSGRGIRRRGCRLCLPQLCRRPRHPPLRIYTQCTPPRVLLCILRLIDTYTNLYQAKKSSNLRL